VLRSQAGKPWTRTLDAIADFSENAPILNVGIWSYATDWGGDAIPEMPLKRGMPLTLYMFILWQQRCFLHIDQRESPLNKNTSLSVSLYHLGLSALDVYLFELRCRQNHAELL